MNTTSFEESIRALERFKSQRAFQEGYAAYMAGVDQTNIPVHMGIFSGNWVEGWMAAANDATEQAGAGKSAVGAIEYTGSRIPLVQSAVSQLTPRTLN